MNANNGSRALSYVFGEGIDWDSPLAATWLYTELPFWLMAPPGTVTVRWSGMSFTITIFEGWIKVFGNRVLDSESTVLFFGPEGSFEPKGELREAIKRRAIVPIARSCKTVLRIDARAHRDVFRQLPEDDHRGRKEQMAYCASLCEAHVPVLNQAIQQYRLATYDYFGYEVSPWDVPTWMLKQDTTSKSVALFYYQEWDYKPLFKELNDPEPHPLELATLSDIESMNSEEATPGEFELLDAGSFMERGDYTGAVRRIVTAIEAVVAGALLSELAKVHGPTEAKRRLSLTENDFPGRLRQWRRLANSKIIHAEFDEFERTRQIRHDIVHKALRLTHADRGRAQRAVDTGRWLFEKIEGKPEKVKLRNASLLKRRVGSIALAPRFPVSISADGIAVMPLSYRKDAK
jgi:hypothetical protein